MTSEKARPGLPKNARCVFKGNIFEVWQWDQKMFDGSSAVFESIWRYPTVEIIATVGDKILIENQDQPDRKNKITLPGGRADNGDDILEEAKRELLEETGYGSHDWRLFKTISLKGKLLYDNHFFIARDCQKIKEPELDPGEKIATKMITFDEFIKLSNEPKFWISQQFINLLLRAEYDKKEKKELRRKIFGE